MRASSLRTKHASRIESIILKATETWFSADLRDSPLQRWSSAKH